MSATEYRVDLRDIKFVLFEQLRIQDRFEGKPPYDEFDKDFYESIVDEAVRLSEEAIAPTNKVGDTVGCRFENGDVITPPGFKEAYDLIAEGGWVGTSGEPEYGGMGLPEIINMVTVEVITGANMAMSIYPGLTKGVANLMVVYGTEEQKELYAPPLFAGEWTGTMLLTEAGAGSDVGENRTKAMRTDEEGVYLLEGEKIFISGGDHDLTENIIHIVLARTPDAEPGTRGLSIFLVPKFLVNDDGSLGERNDIRVTGIEEKMGIHGSATCTLALGADGPCRGYILGEEGQGMRIMFHLMNEARIFAGLQPLSAAAPVYLNAVAYAKERVQGVAIETIQDPEAPKVTINMHPDVRRMLMTMKVLVETSRAFLYECALYEDLKRTAEDLSEKEIYHDMVELYTPICKSHCSDLAFDIASTAMQVMGGYGYIQEYPVEQAVRDIRIASIYEGANGIQAMDLLGRKMRMKNGMMFMQWLGRITERLNGHKGLGFDDEIAALEKTRDNLSAAGMHLFQFAMMGKLRSAFVNASDFLTMFGHFLLGLSALKQAVVAQQALDEGASDEAFYRGKVLNLKFYVAHILPMADALAVVIRSGDESCLDDALFACDD